MDDDFAFEEEKGEQKGGPETRKVDQKGGPETHPDIEVNFVENEDVPQGGTQGGTQDDTQGDTQDDTQDGTQGKDLDKWIEYQVAVYPKITTGELAQLSGKSIITIKRRIAKMPHIVYVGSGYSGHWEVRKKERL